MINAYLLLPPILATLIYFFANFVVFENDFEMKYEAATNWLFFVNQNLLADVSFNVVSVDVVSLAR